MPPLRGDPSIERLLQHAGVRGKRGAPSDLGMSDAEGCRAEAEDHAGDDEPAQRLALARREPLLRVPPHVAVPDVDEAPERQVLEAGAATVLRPRGGDDPDALSLRGQAAAEVDGLEPGR